MRLNSDILCNVKLSWNGCYVDLEGPHVILRRATMYVPRQLPGIPGRAPFHHGPCYEVMDDGETGGSTYGCKWRINDKSSFSNFTWLNHASHSLFKMWNRLFSFVEHSLRFIPSTVGYVMMRSVVVSYRYPCGWILDMVSYLYHQVCSALNITPLQPWWLFDN